MLKALVIGGMVLAAIPSFAQTTSSSSSPSVSPVSSPLSPSSSVAASSVPTTSVASPAAASSSITIARPLTTSAWVEAGRQSIERVEDARDAEARAQDPEVRPRTRLQFGVALKQTMSPGSDTDSSFKPNWVWRWRGKGSSINDRLAPAYRLSSYTTVVHSMVGGRDLEVGDVKVRPLMLGLDYKMPRGKWNWTAGMSAGWAINEVEVPWQMRAIAADFGARDLWVDVHNSFVWGPRLKGWYDVDRRISFMVESAYLVTRPELDVRSHGLTWTRRLNADAFIVKAGIVYGIF